MRRAQTFAEVLNDYLAAEGMAEREFVTRTGLHPDECRGDEVRPRPVRQHRPDKDRERPPARPRVGGALLRLHAGGA